MNDGQYIDKFLYRLLGSIGCVLGGVCTVYSIHILLNRIPAMIDVARDFDTPLPAIVVLAFRLPWLPVVVSVPGFLLGLWAVQSVRRDALGLCWVFALIGLVAVVLYAYALSSTFHHLIVSMTGG